MSRFHVIANRKAVFLDFSLLLFIGVGKNPNYCRKRHSTV